MDNWMLLSLGFGSFVVGIILGMALYRLLWHVDTMALRAEITTFKNYNKNLQEEIFHLRSTHEDLRERIAMLEETNGELARDYRRKNGEVNVHMAVVGELRERVAKLEGINLELERNMR